MQPKDIIDRFGFDKNNVWVLKTDVKECFDHLSHEWILDHAPMNKKLLKIYYHVGISIKVIFYPTFEGMPQGGVLSPVFTTLTLSGFENIINNKYSGSNVRMIRFVDDFLFSGDNKEILSCVLEDLTLFFIRKGFGII